jgi:low affinity Fe/Cu permease
MPPEATDPSAASYPINKSGGDSEESMPSSLKRASKKPDLKVVSKTEKQGLSLGKLFGDIANAISHAAGRASTFMLAIFIIAVWAISGPYYNFSDTWQLIINTGTTIITFLMVFLIQNTQNRDSAAIQVKLDELIRVGSAHNTFVGIEHLTDEELDEIRKKCERRANKGLAGTTAGLRVAKKTEKAAERAGE